MASQLNSQFLELIHRSHSFVWIFFPLCLGIIFWGGQYRGYKKITFHQHSLHFLAGDVAVLALPEVLRDGKTLELQLEKLNPQVALVPVHLFNSKHQVASSWEDHMGA